MDQLLVVSGRSSLTLLSQALRSLSELRFADHYYGNLLDLTISFRQTLLQRLVSRFYDYDHLENGSFSTAQSNISTASHNDGVSWRLQSTPCTTLNAISTLPQPCCKQRTTKNFWRHVKTLSLLQTTRTMENLGSFSLDKYRIMHSVFPWQHFIDPPSTDKKATVCIRHQGATFFAACPRLYDTREPMSGTSIGWSLQSLYYLV